MTPIKNINSNIGKEKPAGAGVEKSKTHIIVEVF